MSALGMFLRAFRRIAEHPEEDLVRPPSRYLPTPTDEFWGDDEPVSPPVIGEEDRDGRRDHE